MANGAKFFRCDLHIHSYGPKGSYDVTDVQSTPEGIVDEAIRKGIEIISVSDHNSIGNVEEVIDKANAAGILAIPGIEVTTQNGHVLFYFEHYHELSEFTGKLNINKEKTLCSETIAQALELADKFNGFGILAHVDSDGGLEEKIKFTDPFVEGVFKKKNLLAVEIKKKENKDTYSSLDTNNERKALLGRVQRAFIPKVIFSDAHQRKNIGTNFQGDEKLTRIKLSTKSFHSLRIALLNADSRVRLEEFIPPTFPRFLDIRFEGGLLDGQEISFNPNMTSIIGGRGTGKSTIIESIKAASNNGPKESMLDKEFWPERIILRYQDEVGDIITFIKDKFDAAINSEDPVDGIDKVKIEDYGQGETANTIHEFSSNPFALLKFLDRFVDISSLEMGEEDILGKISETASEIEDLEMSLSRETEIKRLKIDADKKVETLKKEKVKEIVAFQENLANELVIRQELEDSITDLIRSLDTLDELNLIETLRFVEKDKLVIGRELFEKIEQAFNSTESELTEAKNASAVVKNKIQKCLKENIDAWKAKEIEIKNKIQEKRKELESQGTTVSMQFIKKVTDDQVKYEREIKDVALKKEKLKDAKKQLRELITRRKAIRQQIFNVRNSYAIGLNRNLQETVSEFHVKIKYNQCIASPDLSQRIKEIMEWRTAAVTKADLISQQVGYFELIESIGKKDTSLLLNVVDTTGSKLFGRAEADSIMSKLAETSNYHTLLLSMVNDDPEISLTKETKLEDGTSSYVTKTFFQLSLGQQQSIILSILLFSKREFPLIIDQPEDNLDSEFIYQTIVNNLKQIKEHRQVIVVTHNANIAILGDSELIVPLKSTNSKTFIGSRGSIDDKQTAEDACKILEGGKQAFEKRKEIYDL